MKQRSPIEIKTSRLATINRITLTRLRDGALLPRQRHEFAFPHVKKVIVGSLDATAHERKLVGEMLGIGLTHDSYNHHVDLIESAGLHRAISLIRKAQVAAVTYGQRLARRSGVRIELSDRHAAGSVENVQKYGNTVHELLHLLDTSAFEWHHALTELKPTGAAKVSANKYTALRYVLRRLATEWLK